MYTKTFLKLFVLVFGLLVLGTSALAAQEGETPVISIALTQDGYTIPQELPEGIVQVDLSNETDAPTEFLFARLNADQTLDSFGAAMAEAGPDALLDLVSLAGGATLEPGGATSLTLNLQPGTYVILNIMGENPLAGTFTVADSETEGAAAPEGDVDVTFLDFAFTMPLTIPSGETVWHIQNSGSQWHEMGLFRIEDDATIAEYVDIVASVAAGEEPAEDEPISMEPSAFIFPLSAGEEMWTTVNLEPGTYVIICFLPDFVSGHAHFELGMINLLSVTEA